MSILSPSRRDHDWRLIGGLDVIRRWVLLVEKKNSWNENETLTDRWNCPAPHPILAVFSPLLRLSPPPSDHDYIYNLDETEGLCDLFDVPILNLWPLASSSERKESFYNIVIIIFQKKQQKNAKQKKITWPREGAMKVSGATAIWQNDQGHLCSGSTSALTVGRHAAPRGIAGLNKTFYFSGNKTNDIYIFGWCNINGLCVSPHFPMCGCVCVCVDMLREVRLWVVSDVWASRRENPTMKRRFSSSGKEWWQYWRTVLSASGSSPEYSRLYRFMLRSQHMVCSTFVKGQ